MQARRARNPDEREAGARSWRCRVRDVGTTVMTLLTIENLKFFVRGDTLESQLIAERDREHSIEVVLSDRRTPVVVEPELAGHDDPAHQVDSSA